MVERVNQRFIGHAIDEGIDCLGVGDVGKLIVLLGEVLNVLLEGLIGPLPTVAKILGVPWRRCGYPGSGRSRLNGDRPSSERC